MDLDFKQLATAIKVIAEEKNLSEDVVQNVVEQALAAAYRRDYGEREQEVRVTMDLDSGEVDAYVTKSVVEDVADSAIEISLQDAKKIDQDAEIDSTVEVHDKVEQFGRVAAQTAKQVILQRLRESEREVVMAEFEDKIGTVVNAIVSRVEGNIVRLEIGKAQAIMPRSEQIQGERHHPGQRLKVYLKDIERGFKGPQLVVSRGSTDFIDWLFRAEVPEMESGAVSIKAIAREPGVRSKIAVSSSVQGVDPVGTFVGGHGTRVNAVMSEVGEQEKIDIVVWDEDTATFISNSLSPTRVNRVEIEQDNKKAKVSVDEDQLSIAIGKNGQNVRLASKLTGYDIDIMADKIAEPAPEANVDAVKPVQKLKRKDELENSLLEAIEEHGE